MTEEQDNGQDTLLIEVWQRGMANHPKELQDGPRRSSGAFFGGI
jgi:hypothetical protein